MFPNFRTPKTINLTFGTIENLLLFGVPILKHITVYILFLDGRSWTWTFQEEIFRERSRVRLKKQKITLHMKKKKPITWENLEVSLTSLVL